MNTPPLLPAPRLNYLDQFRGYTVFGMIAVNFVGAFKSIPPLFHHHNTYCSYADTIMPQFFFAVGFALRYTLMKRIERDGWVSAHLRIVRRIFALLVIAAIVHGFDRFPGDWEKLQTVSLLDWLKAVGSRNFFQTLTHIAVATLWVLPVIGQRWPIRLLWLLGSIALHLWCTHTFYLKFALDRPVIDGGPLGFLTWSIPVLAGSFIADYLNSPSRRGIFFTLLLSGILVMGVGYGLSCLKVLPVDAGTNEALDRGDGPAWELAPPPFMPPRFPLRPEATYAERHNINRYDVLTLWTMSQQTGSTSYLVFGTGVSLVVLALCYLLFGQTRQIGVFRTLGSNALVAYIVHGMAIDAVVNLMPKDGPVWFVLVGLLVVMTITWAVCYALERRGWYVRV